MSNPLVSVIIAAHNGELYVQEAIQSILNQDYPAYEIWVIDNGSTDQTKKIAQQFPQIHYRRLKTGNVARARNHGVFLSKGKYIAFLDQDDTWTSNKLTKQVQFLESTHAFQAVISLQTMYLQANCVKPHWLKSSFLNTPQWAYLPSALMSHRSFFLDMGGFDPTLSLTSDVDWFFKCNRLGFDMGVIQEVLIHRRIHEQNQSNHCSILQKELLLIMKNSLIKQREPSCLTK